jgi:hypothetical protein
VGLIDAARLVSAAGGAVVWAGIHGVWRTPQFAWTQGCLAHLVLALPLGTAGALLVSGCRTRMP